MLIYGVKGDMYFGTEAQVEKFSDESIKVTVRTQQGRLQMTIHKHEAEMLLNSMTEVLKGAQTKMGYVWAAPYAEHLADTEADKVADL